MCCCNWRKGNQSSTCAASQCNACAALMDGKGAKVIVTHVPLNCNKATKILYLSFFKWNLGHCAPKMTNSIIEMSCKLQGIQCANPDNCNTVGINNWLWTEFKINLLGFKWLTCHFLELQATWLLLESFDARLIWYWTHLKLDWFQAGLIWCWTHSKLDLFVWHWTWSKLDSFKAGLVQSLTHLKLNSFEAWLFWSSTL